MAQHLRAFGALTEDLGLVASTHQAAHIYLNSTSRVSYSNVMCLCPLLRLPLPWQISFFFTDLRDLQSSPVGLLRFFSGSHSELFLTCLLPSCLSFFLPGSRDSWPMSRRTHQGGQGGCAVQSSRGRGICLWWLSLTSGTLQERPDTHRRPVVESLLSDVHPQKSTDHRVSAQNLGQTVIHKTKEIKINK